MHPMHVEQVARMVTEQHLHEAAEARRARALVGGPHPLRDRLGARLVAVGTRLQTRPAARRAVSPC